MPNIISVNKETTVSAPGVIDQNFHVGDLIAPNSPYYWPIWWAGYGTDTGEVYDPDTEQVFAPTFVVVGETNPDIARGGVWIQTFPNGDWTMWIEDGT